MRYNHTNPNKIYSMDEIRSLAPSVFAEEPKADVSSKYEFVPTYKVVDALCNEGWQVSKVQEMRANAEDNQGFQKHLLRFRRQDLTIGEDFVEMVLVNSHNRTAAYQLMAGIFRLVCSNGLIVGDTFNRISVKHMGNTTDDVMDASFEIIKSAPQISERIQEVKAIDISQQQREIYAESAAIAMYGDVESVPYDSTQLLRARRYEDRDTINSLWTTYNVVQENLIKGGIRGQKIVTDASSGRDRVKRTTSRQVKAIDKDVKINKALWNLTEKMTKLMKSI